jgi:pimeloyl-ACP methyl ester carboxylesterase
MPHSFSRTIVTTIAPLAFTLATGCGAESPPAGRETPFQKQSLAPSTGITLAYVEAGDPAGAPVILLHGYTDTGRSFYPMMRELLGLRPDLRLIALDQRGHGASSMPPAESCRAAPERCFRPADFAGDVLAFMEQKGIRRAYVVGHSMGSLVAQELALTRPERVRRLVLIGSFARTVDHPALKDFLLAGLIEGPWREALVGRGLVFPDDVYDLTPLAADSGAEAWMRANWVTEPLADSAFLAAIAPETARTRLGTWIGVARALLAVDHTERLKDLRVPTLAIWATQEIAHNVQWGAPAAVAADLAAFLRDDGAPTRDLYFADPQDPRRVATAEGEAALIEYRPRNCPVGQGGGVG